MNCKWRRQRTILIFGWLLAWLLAISPLAISPQAEAQGFKL